MSAILILVFFSILSFTTLNQTIGVVEIDKLQQKKYHIAITEISNHIKNFNKEFGRYPNDLEEISNTEGYLFVKLYKNKSWLHYAVSNGINQPPWRSNRAVVFSLGKDIANTEYLSGLNNKCGTEDFFLAASWCGDDSEIWEKMESRNRYLAQAKKQQISLNNLLDKFISFFEAKHTFPKEQSNNTFIADGETKTLASIIGFSGDPGLCGGVYNFEDVPLGCEDLYSLDGHAITYTYINYRSIELKTHVNAIDSMGNKLELTASIIMPTPDPDEYPPFDENGLACNNTACKIEGTDFSFSKTGAVDQNYKTSQEYCESKGPGWIVPKIDDAIFLMLNAPIDIVGTFGVQSSTEWHIWPEYYYYIAYPICSVYGTNKWIKHKIGWSLLGTGIKTVCIKK